MKFGQLNTLCQSNIFFQKMMQKMRQGDEF